MLFAGVTETLFGCYPKHLVVPIYSNTTLVTISNFISIALSGAVSEAQWGEGSSAAAG